MGDEVERVVELALGYLDRRMRSRWEIEQYLRRKSVPAAVAEQVMSRLDGLGVLDDAAYARAFARDRVRLRPKGYMLIARELTARGVARADIDTALPEVEAEFPEPKVASDLLARRRRQYAGLDRSDAEAKARRWLGGRGFRHETVRAVIEAASWLGEDGAGPDERELRIDP